MGISTLQNYTNSIIGPDLFDLKGHLEREEGKELRGIGMRLRSYLEQQNVCYKIVLEVSLFSVSSDIITSY